MESNQPITTPEQIVDRALDLLRRFTTYKKEVHVLAALNGSVRQPDLSRAKTLHWKHNRYVARVGDDFVSLERWQQIADALDSRIHTWAALEHYGQSGNKK
jgi:hypothetical protein